MLGTLAVTGACAVFSQLQGSFFSVKPSGSRRGLPKLGLGNELCWQSVNDTVLSRAVAATGSTIGRYPGGTPSDYVRAQTLHRMLLLS
jgi:hypothetical protein